MIGPTRPHRRSAPWRLAPLLLAFAALPAVGWAAAPVASTTTTTTSVVTTTATVAGIDAAPLLECPRPDCAVRTRVPRGRSVGIEGEPTAGYAPVTDGRERGFVNDTYLFRDGAPAPWLISGAPGCDRVALLFNIGSGFEPATDILDTLAAERVPATMFVMGWWAEQNADLLQRLTASFPIGSHGYLPPELTERSDWDVADDLQTAAAAIAAAGGAPPGPWFTPYAAGTNERVRAIAAGQGYLSVGWSVATDDWRPDVTADEIYRRVVDQIHDGAIVELHFDSSATTGTTALALPDIVSTLRARGYRFVTIPEMAEPCGAFGDGVSATPSASTTGVPT